MIHNKMRLHLKRKHKDVYRILLTEYRKKFGSKKPLFHPRKFSDDSHFKCQKCNYSTNFQRTFDTHLFDEHLETSCQTCGVSFNNFDEYYKHLMSHMNPIHCELCGKYSLDQERYDYHIKMGHRDESGNGFCPTCGIYCKTVKMHILNVHNDGKNGPKRKKFLCPHCDYVGQHRAALEIHTNSVHSESNILNCPWCGRLTKDLNKHLRNNQCNIPEEERVFKPKVKCKSCEKEFKSIGKLNQHISQIHELKMNFCDQCDYKTPVAGNLRLHVKRKHEGRPLKEECQVCHKMCVSIEGHMKIYHGHLVNKTKF